ncbi:MAG: serine/threonine protein kinase [Gemmatimonadetes bacterium]|nr:MAG: serine/threonine protein kinase [Gemmatimonadota bacterium]
MTGVAGATVGAGVDILGYRIVELIGESGPWVTWRAVADDGVRVTIKTARAQYPRARDLAELRREYEVLRKLALPGIVAARALVPHGSGNLALVTESVGKPLSQLMTERAREPLPLDRFFPLVIRLTRTLGALHERHVVHKDVTPHSIYVDPETWEPYLTNFGLCSELSLERQSAKLSTKLEGSLPYISPEQTGRTSRDVDWRSDYYSLGVTCFELITGTLPFEAKDALEWAHRHISQPPPLASDRRSDVPVALALVLEKLMAKSAEQRYQSTFGLIADLERCRAAARSGDGAHAFALGADDVSRRFQMPQRLYGRKREVEQLVRLFEESAKGATVFALVSGYSGVGKSALVAEMGRAIVQRRGYLAEGKFDQFQQAAAYGAIASAFRGLVDQLLGEPPAHLAAWRAALQQGLGANAGLVTALVPELALVIGEVPPVPELPPAEAQTRFQLTVASLVKVFATAEHPLVLFMDDLQWSDVPTLHLLSRLATARDVGHLLIIGAYRDNAVDATHPLTVTLDQLRKVRDLAELSLQPLAAPAVDQLVADTLRVEPTRAEPLARLVFEKAQGNPFFVRELLRTLHEDGAIVFDPDAGRWRWDDVAVAAAGVGENVVDFLVGSLRRLPAETQEVLQLAACIGGTFDLGTLALIAERTPAETAEALQAALQRQAIVPLTESYRLVAHGAAEDGGSGGDASRTTYRFQHDRVQQAAYALIGEERRQAVHRSIGRLMLKHADVAERETRLIDIVSHLNQGRALIEDDAERWELVRLDVDAGRMAVRSAAYDSGLGFLRIALELAGPDAWETDHALMMELGTEIQRCAYQVADYADADAWTERLLTRAETPLAKAEVLSDRVRQYATMGRMRESIDAALAGLAVLGVEIPAAPTRDDVQRELEAVHAALGDRSIESLIDAPEIDDPAARIAVRLIMEVFAASFLSGAGEIFPFLILRNVTLSLRYGNSPEAAFAYAAFGMLLCGSLDAPAAGERWGRLAVAMNEKLDDLPLRSRIIYVYAMFISHWNHHWSSMTPWFLRGIEAGYQSGDMLYLAYSAQDCILWDPTIDLATQSRETRKYLAIVKDCEYQDSYDSGTLSLRMQLNFQGLTDGEYSMNDASFDEERCLAGMRQRQFMTGVANYHIYKAEIHLLFGDFAGALPHVEVMDRMIASAMSLPQLVRYRIVAFLVRAALLERLPVDERVAERARLEAHLAQMAAWSPNCPENFEHLRLTMEGELARLDDRATEALAFYEQAIAAAHASGFRRDEAVANELAARLLTTLGAPRAAEGYLRAARHLYEQWGAARKVAQLDRAHPELSAAARIAPRTTGSHGAISMDTTALDMGSVIKASQTISGEMVVEQLLRTTLQILLENAGATIGYFVVREGDALVLRSQAGTVEAGVTRSLPIPLTAEGDQVLPLSIVNHVLRTGAPLVLADGASAGRFASDPYVRARRPKSVICVPIERARRFSGAIYMENDLITGAFTEDRVEVIKLLAAQAAISVENARLYEDQLRLTAAQGRFVPGQFLEHLGHRDIAEVGLGEFVAREMSVMFADLRGFTPLAERLAPREVIDLLNRYFSRIGVPVAEAGGFVDSYNGDEIMALFPLPAERAVRAGVAMATALVEFNRESQRDGGPALAMGMGVNSGPLVLGTVGSADRLKCGVVGDTVNTASRIEQLTKRYGARFLIGEETQRRLGGDASFTLRAVDRVAAKGKAQAMTLYEVLDAEEPARRAAKESTLALLDEARDLYTHARFAEAGRVIASARAIDPHDAALDVLAARCGRYELDPPPADWQGVEALDSK